MGKAEEHLNFRYWHHSPFCLYPLFLTFTGQTWLFLRSIRATWLEPKHRIRETGLFDLGHAAFYAIGAYITAILNTLYGIPIIWLIPLSAIGAGLLRI